MEYFRLPQEPVASSNDRMKFPTKLPRTTLTNAPDSCDRLTIFAPGEITDGLSDSQLSTDMKMPVKIIKTADISELYASIGQVRKHERIIIVFS